MPRGRSRPTAVATLSNGASTPRRRSSPRTPTSAPTSWVASVWNGIFRARVSFPISAIGWSVPISLFAAITETRTVSVRRAPRTSSGSTIPCRSTGKAVTVNPRPSRKRHVSRIA